MDTVDARLLEIVTYVREFFGKPVTINSACRCTKHNAAIGGRPNSYHLKSRAADIVVEGIPPEAVADYLENSRFADEIGVGRYASFTHVDSRGYKARWNG